MRVSNGSAASIAGKLVDDGIIAGIALGRFDPAFSDILLIAVTETHTKADLDRLVAALAGAAGD